MKKYDIELYTELCCDECNDIIHSHFDCPICKTSYAGTTIYGNPADHDDGEFACEECKMEFKILEQDFDKLTICIKGEEDE